MWIGQDSVVPSHIGGDEVEEELIWKVVAGRCGIEDGPVGGTSKGV